MLDFVPPLTRSVIQMVLIILWNAEKLPPGIFGIHTPVPSSTSSVVRVTVAIVVIAGGGGGVVIIIFQLKIEKFIINFLTWSLFIASKSLFRISMLKRVQLWPCEPATKPKLNNENPRTCYDVL